MRLHRKIHAKTWTISTVVVVVVVAIIVFLPQFSPMHLIYHTETVKLPIPSYQGTISVEEALKLRRSVKQFQNSPLNLQQIGQLLWAAQGLSSSSGERTSPSTGEIYPLSAYVVSNGVDGLAPGVYLYQPAKNSLLPILKGDKSTELARIAYNQNDINAAPACIIITADYKPSAVKFGERGKQLVLLEAGHAAENVYLQAAALKLGTTVVDIFDESKLSQTLQLPTNETPLYIMPVGKPQSTKAATGGKAS